MSGAISGIGGGHHSVGHAQKAHKSKGGQGGGHDGGGAEGSSKKGDRVDWSSEMLEGAKDSSKRSLESVKKFGESLLE